VSEKLANDIEYSQIQLKVAEGLKKGNVALEKANSLFRYGNGTTYCTYKL